MNSKWLFGIGIAMGIVASAYSVLQSDLNFVLLSIVWVFILTNGLRGQAFRERGMKKEAKFMYGLSLFFSVAFIVLLIFSVF